MTVFLTALENRSKNIPLINREYLAIGTMVYKHDISRANYARQRGHLARTQHTLKLIPDVDGTPAVAQWAAISFENVV